MDLYHNIEQNKAVRFADDVVEEIITNGFAAGFEGKVWLSSKPLGDGCGTFTGLVVHARGNLASYREYTDGIEDLGVRVYALPVEVVNKFPREQYYPRDGELVE